MGTELQMLAWAIVLGLAQLAIAATATTGQRGLMWGAGARDGDPPPVNALAARLDRAFRNFLETFGFFAAAVLLLHATGRGNTSSAMGAQLYFWARVKPSTTAFLRSRASPRARPSPSASARVCRRSCCTITVVFAPAGWNFTSTGVPGAASAWVQSSLMVLFGVNFFTVARLPSALASVAPSFSSNWCLGPSQRSSALALAKAP